MTIRINVHHYFEQSGHNSEVMSLLNELKTQNQEIMATITQLNEKVDALQSALDTEQEQIAEAIATLQQTVTDLQAMIADGGTTEERQALADKLDAVIADLQGTIADTPVEPPAPEPEP